MKGAKMAGLLALLLLLIGLPTAIVRADDVAAAEQVNTVTVHVDGMT